MAIDKKYGNVTVQRDSTVHPLNNTVEPVFVLRASDRAAVDTLTDYKHNAMLEGCGDKMLEMMERTISEFESWQSANLDRVKIPD